MMLGLNNDLQSCLVKKFSAVMFDSLTIMILHISSMVQAAAFGKINCYRMLACELLVTQSIVVPSILTVWAVVMFLKNSLFCVLLFAFTSFGIGSVSIAQDSPATTSETSPLVDAKWLAANLDQVRIISSGQTAEQFVEGHIPNALFVDWRTQITDPANSDLFSLPTKTQLETLLSNLGITPQTTIVLTDNRSNRISTRLFWSLKMFGHQNVKILNGGIGAWKSAGMSMSKQNLEIAPTKYQFSNANQKYAAANIANTQDVRNSVEQGDVLIDGRPENQYTGDVPGRVFHTNLPHQRRGHIKSAINIPWKENFTADGKFKSIEALRELYKQAGVTDDQQVVTYCNEGLHAAAPWFVLKELLGHPNVKLYDDSMGVWANRSDTPMTKTEATKD